MASLELSGISITFGGLRAVDHLSFVAPAGSIKGIIGPNGAGKTTLFNAISGITTPQAGRILLGGRDVTALRPYQRAALGLSRTFQNLQIFADVGLAFKLSFANKCDEAERPVVAEYFQRCFDRELDSSLSLPGRGLG